MTYALTLSGDGARGIASFCYYRKKSCHHFSTNAFNPSASAMKIDNSGDTTNPNKPK